MYILEKDHKTNPRNSRNYEKRHWSLEEKRDIFFWYSYSRYKEWGGKNYSMIMMKKLKEGRLKEKNEKTDTKNLDSICSVTHHYFPVKIINEMIQSRST